jgi:transposase
MATQSQETLLPDPECLRLVRLEASARLITAVVTTNAKAARCPLCQSLSEKVHSRYTRRVADLPWMGCSVRLQLFTRRFFCLNQECEQAIFTERLPTVVAPYARRTLWLSDVYVRYNSKSVTSSGTPSSQWKRFVYISSEECPMVEIRWEGVLQRSCAGIRDCGKRSV